MKVKELIEKLQRADPDLEVFFRRPSVTGNICEVDKVEKDAYGFFGTKEPCIILDRFRPGDLNDAGEPIKRESWL